MGLIQGGIVTCTYTCIIYTVHFTVDIGHCAIYIIYWTLYIGHYTVYSVQCTLYTVHCTVYIPIGITPRMLTCGQPVLMTSDTYGTCKD